MVWFGEALPAPTLRRAVDASEAAKLLLGIGTSGRVYPAAELSRLAQRQGARWVEIDTHPTALSEGADSSCGARPARSLPSLATGLGLGRVDAPGASL